jgi:hypothetical protein
MNLVEIIEKGHTVAQRDKVVKYVGESPARFAELVRVFLKGPYRVTQRAAWPLSFCVESHPDLVTPHLRVLLKNLKKEGQHDAVKRNTMRLLQFIDIPKSLQGEAANACFDLLSNAKEPIAVRVFAMTVLANIALKQPELRNELIPMIEDQMPYGSAAFVSRGRKTLKLLKSKSMDQQPKSR